MLIRGIESEVLPVAERYGMGTLMWSPLAMGLLTGRVRQDPPGDLRRTGFFKHMTDERRIDTVEQIIPASDMVEAQWVSDEVLDQIDAIVPPGTDIGRMDMAYSPPALQDARLRRRPADSRGAG